MKMSIISIFKHLLLLISILSFNIKAAPVERDWKMLGDGLLTYDANTGLEW